MRTIKQKIYTFDELSKEVQERVIDEWRINDDLAELPDELDFKLDLLLASNNITFEQEPKIYYSLNYCQGDGAMFEGAFTWQGRYVAHIKQSGHYYHYNSKDIELLTVEGNGVSLQKQEEFNNLYVEICRELEKYGYAVIENAQDAETLPKLSGQMTTNSIKTERCIKE
jgi:hypothetical protein